MLLALDDAAPYDLLPAFRRHLCEVSAVEDVSVWLADYAGRSLGRLPETSGQPDVVLPIDRDGHGEAFRQQHVVAEPGTQGYDVYVPVTFRSERLGVLEVRLPSPPDVELRHELSATGVALAHVLLAARRYTDLFELPRRRQEMELPAEMQWELLPVLAHTGPDFAVAGWLEPAYDIAGDNFDYAVDRATLTVSLTDAMGHGTGAALLSSLLVAATRNARRRRLGVRQQVRAGNTAVHDQFSGDVYATGVFLQIHRADGAVELVNAGHPTAYLLRDGEVTTLSAEPDLPVGLFPATEYTTHEARLLPGDRLLLLSDGVLEAAPERGSEFGAARVRAHLLASDHRPPGEVVRLLTLAVMEHRAGHLADDATALCVDYRRPHRPTPDARIERVLPG